MQLRNWKYIIIYHFISNFQTFLSNITVALLGELFLFCVLNVFPKKLHKFIRSTILNSNMGLLLT